MIESHNNSRRRVLKGTLGLTTLAAAALISALSTPS